MPERYYPQFQDGIDTITIRAPHPGYNSDLEGKGYNEPGVGRGIHNRNLQKRARLFAGTVAMGASVAALLGSVWHIMDRPIFGVQEVNVGSQTTRLIEEGVIFVGGIGLILPDIYPPKKRSKIS